MIAFQLLLVQCAHLAGLDCDPKQPREERFTSTSLFCCCGVNMLLYKQQHGGNSNYN